MVNECIPLYEGPGPRTSAYATATIAGRRLVKISGDFESGPALNSGSDGGLVKVAQCVANEKAFGVSAYDAVLGDTLPIIRGAGAVVPIDAAASLAAGVEVAADANGKIVAYDRANIATKHAVGFLVSACTNGDVGYVSLYA